MIALDERGGFVPEPPPPTRTLSDGWAVGLAAAAAAGAWHRVPAPPLLAVVVVGLGLVVRRPWVLLVGVAALAGALSVRAWAGLDDPPIGPIRAAATLVSDPSDTPFGVRADVRIDGRRYELEADGPGAGALGTSLAGERIALAGRVRPPPPAAGWLVPRHVVATIEASQVERTGAGSAPWRGANRVRRLLERGSADLGDLQRTLFRGFVLGDDRNQPAEIVDDFRGAGLTHVMVASGQNIAFLLVLAGPAIRRCRWPGRWAITMAMVGSFAVVTRFEPSILRASAMAVLATTAQALGRPSTSVRTLALAVTGLVLVDPLLVHAVGFQLSVGASAGIALLGAPIGERLPGPRVVAEAIAVTVAAQVGVAPIVLSRFDGMPVVSLLANPIAVPVAGFVTTWGLPAGLLAGTFGGSVATIVHLPTRLAIGWVAEVARVSATVPLGEVRVPHALGLAAIATLGMVAGTRWRSMAVVASAAAVVVLLLPALALRAPPEVQALARGTEVRRVGGRTEVALGGDPVPDLLEGLRRAGVRRIDVLRAGSPVDAATLRALRHRWTVRTVIAPGEGQPPGRRSSTSRRPPSTSSRSVSCHPRASSASSGASSGLAGSSNGVDTYKIRSAAAT